MNPLFPCVMRPFVEIIALHHQKKEVLAMKKFAILTLALALSCVMLVGCGCMNTNADVTTLPTNGETSAPTRATTEPTTQATTMPTTQPQTEPSSENGTDTTGGDTTESTGALEGAMDDIMGGSTDDATEGGSGESGPARGRIRGNGPRS